MTEPTLGDLFRTIKQHSHNMLDRVEVAFWWLSHHHYGQWSQSYKDFCKLGRVYDPGMTSGPNDVLAYDACCEAFGCEHDDRMVEH